MPRTPSDRTEGPRKKTNIMIVPFVEPTETAELLKALRAPGPALGGTCPKCDENLEVVWCNASVPAGEWTIRFERTIGGPLRRG
jgi:hypothetical protein